MPCRLAGPLLPTPNRDVDIFWIELDDPRLSAGLRGCDDGGPRSTSGIEDEIAPMGDIADRIGNHRAVLNGRMPRELFLAVRPEAREAAVVPDIGSAAPVATKLNTVLMWRFALL